MTQACEQESLDTSILKDKSNPVVKIATNHGDMFIELYKQEAPIGVANFLDYSKENYYNDTIFHRVIDGFMIQGGGFEKDLSQKETKDPIKNEANNGLSNKRGTLAYARTQVVDSATSQFFINVVDNNFLDHSGNNPKQFGYAVFGNVVEGLDVVDKIKKVATTTVPPYQDVPAEPVVIENVIIIQQ